MTPQIPLCDRLDETRDDIDQENQLADLSVEAARLREVWLETAPDYSQQWDDEERQAYEDEEQAEYLRNYAERDHPHGSGSPTSADPLSTWILAAAALGCVALGLWWL